MTANFSKVSPSYCDEVIYVMKYWIFMNALIIKRKLISKSKTIALKSISFFDGELFYLNSK